MEQNKEKIRYILQNHVDEGDNVIKTCEKMCFL